MARGGINTLLPLDRYAEIMAIHPDAFNQVYNPEQPYPSDCNDVWLAHGYTGGADRITGRYDVCQAIATAEGQLASFLGFSVAPDWTANEEHPWPYPKRGIQTMYPPIQCNRGYISGAGVRATSVIEADAAIAYSDEDGDGVPDTATITIAAVTWAASAAVLGEVAVFYADQTDDLYRIRNLSISENDAGQLVITGRRSYFVDPDLWLDDEEINLDTDGNFLTTVDVLRRYNDTSQAQELVFRGTPATLCGTELCVDTTQDACLIVDNHRIGTVLVIPGSYDDGWTWACFTNNLTPNAVRLWYYAGLPLQADGRIRPDLAEAIVRLANTYLPEAPCGCDLTRERWKRDREEQDMNSFNIAMAESFFGSTRRGASFAVSVARRLGPIASAGHI